MVMLRIRLEGLELRDSLARGLVRGKEVLVRRIALEAAKKARDRAHIKSGSLRRSITARWSARGGALIAAGARHARYEVARGGDHDFWSPTLREASLELRRGLARLLAKNLREVRRGR